MLVPVPVLEDGQWDALTTRVIDTTKADYFDQIGLLLKDAGKNFSLLEAFGVLGVCPRGFADEFTASIVALESDVATYHVLPGGGGICDEPAWLMQAFRAVRQARDDYYLWKYRKKQGAHDD